MGWGEKAIEIRSVETGHLDGVFMHKRAQRLKFLCERNDKVKKHLENTWHALIVICLQVVVIAALHMHVHKNTKTLIVSMKFGTICIDLTEPKVIPFQMWTDVCGETCI